MSPAELFAANTSPLELLGALAHGIVGLATNLLLGVTLAVLAARLMRAKGIHWGWAAIACPAIFVLRAPLHGAAVVLLVAALTATRRARRWHREDLEAGADLAQAAARRLSPSDALGLAWRTHLVKRWPGPRICSSREGEMVLGVDASGRTVSVPFGGARGGTHTLLVGATGSGKTVTQTSMAVRAIEQGMGAIVLDPKGDESMRLALLAATRTAGKDFVEWTPHGPCPYNPFARGSDTEIADKALAGERFTEPHYLRQAQRFLGHVVRTLHAARVETGLRQIVQHLDPAELELLARTLPTEQADVIHAYLDSLTTRQLTDLAGVRDRLSILAESDVGCWLDPEHDGVHAFDLLGVAQRQDVAYFRLDADRRPLLTEMLGAAIVQDLQTVVSSLQESPTPVVVIIDEFSALATEHVVRLFGRARSAGFSLILSTQELSDLRLPGREALLERVLGNLTVLLAHRQVVPSSAEMLGSLAGVRGVWKTSFNGNGRITRTRTREGVLKPEQVMDLAPGSVAAIVPGSGANVRFARVIVPGREER
jgi:type IV secretory pathway TraG/TraD family ATPase VirD4